MATTTTLALPKPPASPPLAPPLLHPAPPPPPLPQPQPSAPPQLRIPIAPTRRNLLLSLATLASSSFPLPQPPQTAHALSPPPLSSLALDDGPPPDLTITDRVYLDICICPSSFSTSRDVGATSPSSLTSSSPPLPPSSSGFRCDDATSLGRLVIGLYGKQVPRTVANFKAMCTGAAGSSYRSCIIHRIIAGQYIVAGKQGPSKEKGEVIPPSNLESNPETISANAFKLRHSRPGTVSLCLSENDDDDQFKLSTRYRNVEFLITTGPGPAPQLDNKNIVFGTVLEGLDVVTAIAAVPTYKPSERIRQLNELASFLGDGRASNARNFWYRPLKALYISDCGAL